MTTKNLSIFHASPLLQDDGTWTDIPRCIEHDPGVDEQIPGTCPSIPGYCAQGFLNTRCRFDCTTGKVTVAESSNNSVETWLCSGYRLAVHSGRHLGALPHLCRGPPGDQGRLWRLSGACRGRQEQNCGGRPQQEHGQWQESSQDYCQQWREEDNPILRREHQHWSH